MAPLDAHAPLHTPRARVPNKFSCGVRGDGGVGWGWGDKGDGPHCKDGELSRSDKNNIDPFLLL